MIHGKVEQERLRSELLSPTFAARGMVGEISKYVMPDEEMRPRVAKQLIEDLLMLDGNSRLNLATFVTTWMEQEARDLMELTFDKNMIDKDEYPKTAEIEMRCVNMLADLWHAPEEAASASPSEPRAGSGAMGCSTIGSSEAAMLGGLALKWQWRKGRQAQGKNRDKPNLVMGVDVQVCWDKFCRYFDVEPRLAPIKGDRYCLNAEEALKLVDENTIGVVAIMGTTFTGEYEPVKEICDALDKLAEQGGPDVPVHVDGASGGFVAPFLQPEIEWDFRLPRVKSINTSGHKYGLVYPGVGWVVWRERKELPEELIFYVNYLGGEMPTFALNFSRPGNQVVAQYYNLLRLGRDGYRRIHSACRDTAMRLSSAIAEMGPFELISDGGAIPVFAFKAKPDCGFSVFDVSHRIREHGWLIPAYTMPPDNQEVAALRIVVKEGFSREMAEELLGDLKSVVHELTRQPCLTPKPDPAKADTKLRC